MKPKSTATELRAAFREWSAAVVDQLDQLIGQLEKPDSPLGRAFKDDRADICNTLERAWHCLNKLPSRAGHPVRTPQVKAMTEELKDAHARASAETA